MFAMPMYECHGTVDVLKTEPLFAGLVAQSCPSLSTTILKLLRLLSNTHLSAAPTCVIDTDKPLVTGYLTGERWDSDVLNPAVNHLP